jgi:hypothetical protein
MSQPPSPTREDYITAQLASSTAPDSSPCPICYEAWATDASPIIRTHCNHVFHRACFVTWLSKEDISSANSCPNCRAIFFPKTARPKEEEEVQPDMSFIYEALREQMVQVMAVRQAAARQELERERREEERLVRAAQEAMMRDLFEEWDQQRREELEG